MKRAVAGFILVFALAIVPWIATNAYMKSAGVVVTGRVLDKRETFLLPGGDTWKHVFEIACEYRTLDSPYPETLVQRVDSPFYRSLHAGSPVRVRYSPSRLLRSFAGMGIYLEDSSILSRLHYGPPDRRDIAMAGALIIAAIFGLVGYLTKNKALGVIAAVIVGVCFPMALLAVSGLLLFPALFWASRRNPGKGYGWAMFTTVALSVGVTYWRVPRPSPLPADSIRNGTAIVQQVRVVDELWSNTWETYGRRAVENIRQPFQMVELVFTPEGASEPIHVLDRIDMNSVAGLRDGSSVPIQYSASDPDSARIAGASRNYARQAITYLFCVVYGAGAVIAFLFIPATHGLRKLFRASPVVQAFTDPSAAITRLRKMNNWTQLTNDDPRLKQLEEMVRARQSRRGGT